MKKSTAAIKSALALVAAANALHKEVDDAHAWEDAFEAAATAAYDAAYAAEDDGERAVLYRYAEACERGARMCLTFAAGGGLMRAAVAAVAAAEALGDLPRVLRETEPEPRPGELRLHPHQRGAFFVASYRIGWDGGQGVTVYQNGKPVAAAEMWRRDDKWALVAPTPRPTYPRGAVQHAATKARADELRAALRALPAATRREIVRCYWGECDFVPLGGGWEYVPGQEGGSLRLPAQGPALEYAGGNGCTPLFIGAGRAVREALDNDFAAYAAELCAIERREAEAAARAEAARRAEAAVAEARALRASFGDRCTL